MTRPLRPLPPCRLRSSRLHRTSPCTLYPVPCTLYPVPCTVEPLASDVHPEWPASHREGDGCTGPWTRPPQGRGESHPGRRRRGRALTRGFEARRRLERCRSIGLRRFGVLIRSGSGPYTCLRALLSEGRVSTGASRHTSGVCTAHCCKAVQDRETVDPVQLCTSPCTAYNLLYTDHSHRFRCPHVTYCVRLYFNV